MSPTPADPFEAIVNEHYQPLFRFAMSLTRSEHDAMDLTQQTFCIWAEKGHQLRDFSKIKSWLYTALYRKFLTGRRTQSRYPHQNLEDVADELPTTLSTDADQGDASNVLVALTKIDKVFQPAVALFYLEECSYKEIAAILGVPIGTVKSRIARGLAQLREVLSGNSPPTAPIDQVVPKKAFAGWDFSGSALRELSFAS